MAMDRLLIHGGLLYDGSGAEGHLADVLVKGQRIEAIGVLDEVADARRINAGGCIVAPGFIDAHRHCDIAALDDMDFGRIELSQGITTVIGGNCGLSAVPLGEAYQRAQLDYLAPILGRYRRLAPPTSFAQYFEALRLAAPPLHVGLLAGSCSIKAALLGFGDRPFTKEALHQALRQVELAMDAGAPGLSMGLMYEPERSSTIEELAFVAGGAKAGDGLLCMHMRTEGDGLLIAIDEAIAIARQAGLRLNISHLKATGAHNWGGLIHRAIDRIERARAEGLDLSADVYPYTAGATTMLSILPGDLARLPTDELLSLLDTKSGVDRLRAAYASPWQQADNLPLSIGWERILVGSATGEEARFSGLSLAEVARQQRCEPEEALARLLVAQGGNCGVIVMSMAQEDVDDVMRLPWVSLISDALYGGGEAPHPRLYDSYPRIIRDYVLARQVLPMAEAIRKATSLPAQKLRLTDRGRLAPGLLADIVVIDPAQLHEGPSFANPRQTPGGIAHTLVAGRLAWSEGSMLGSEADAGKP